MRSFKTLFVLVLVVLISNDQKVRGEIDNLVDYKKVEFKNEGEKIFLRNISITGCDDNYFVADGKRNKIYKMDKEFHVLNSFGRAGKGPGEFVHIIDIVTKKSKIYALSGGNNMLNVFSNDCEFIRSVPLNTEFFECRYAIDNKENIYIPNPDAGKLITKLDKKGNKINNFGELIVGENKGLNRNLGHILISGNNVFFMSYTEPILKIFSTEGQLKKKYDLSDSLEIYNKKYKSNVQKRNNIKGKQLVLLNNDIGQIGNKLYIQTSHFKSNSKNWTTTLIIELKYQDKLELVNAFLLSPDGAYLNLFSNNDKLFLYDMVSKGIHRYNLENIGK